MNILFRATVAILIGSLAIKAIEYPIPMIDQNPPKPNIIRIYFTPEEDQLLTQLVEEQRAQTGKDKIKFAPIAKSFNQKAALNKNINERKPFQLRERWNYYLNPALNRGAWTPEEDDKIAQMYKEFGPKWAKIAKFLSGRSAQDIRNRWRFIERQPQKDEDEVLAQQPGVSIDLLAPMSVENPLSPQKPAEPTPMIAPNQAKPKIVKNHFTPEEDDLLYQLIEEQRAQTGKNALNFTTIAKSFNQKALLNKNINERTARQLRNRWQRCLDPSLNRGTWTAEEDAQILQMYRDFGPQWAKMARRLNGRSGTDINNRWRFIERQQQKDENTILAQQSMVSVPQPVVSVDYLSILSFRNFVHSQNLPDTKDIPDILDTKDDPFEILKPAI